MRNIILSIIAALLVAPLAWGLIRYRTIDTCEMVKKEVMSDVAANMLRTELSPLDLAQGELMVKHSLSGENWFSCVGILTNIKNGIRPDTDFESDKLDVYVIRDGLTTSRSDAAVRKTEIDIKLISSSLDQYRLDMGRYPSQSEGLLALAQPPEDAGSYRPGGYISSSSLTDVWGNSFQYTSINDGEGFSVCSYGEDGSPGGSGADADICKSYPE